MPIQAELPAEKAKIDAPLAYPEGKVDENAVDIALTSHIVPRQSFRVTDRNAGYIGPSSLKSISRTWRTACAPTRPAPAEDNTRVAVVRSAFTDRLRNKHDDPLAASATSLMPMTIVTRFSAVAP